MTVCATGDKIEKADGFRNACLNPLTTSSITWGNWFVRTEGCIKSQKGVDKTPFSIL